MGENAGRVARRAHVNLQDLSSGEAIMLQSTSSSPSSSSCLSSLLLFGTNLFRKNTPERWISSLFLLWTTWMLVGTSFYKYYCSYSWAKAFYMNVNVGWGVNWSLDDSFFADDYFREWEMQLFSLVHTAIGSIFIGYCCTYIAKLIVLKKNQWLEDATKKEENSKYNVLSWVEEKFPSLYDALSNEVLKVSCIMLVWILLGLVYYAITHELRLAEGVDYTFSASTGAGYKSLPESDPNYSYATFALYCVFAVPLVAVSFGLIATTFFEAPHFRLMDRMFADVYPEEINFMIDFGLIDSIGQLSQEEFIILMAVRIDRASPALIRTIHQRFLELDRRRLGFLIVDELLESKFSKHRHTFEVDKNNRLVVRTKQEIEERRLETSEIELGVASEEENSSSRHQGTNITRHEEADRHQRFGTKKLSINTALDDDDLANATIIPSGTLENARKASMLKKNLFSIVGTMQKEYINHGNHANNLYSPLKAGQALTLRFPSRRSSVRSSRRGSLDGRADESPHCSTRKNFVSSPSLPKQAAYLRRSKSADVPNDDNIKSTPLASFKRRFSAFPLPTSPLREVALRRKSIEKISPSFRLSKQYPSSPSDSEETPTRKGEECSDASLKNADFSALPSTTNMKLFRRVSSIDKSVGSFCESHSDSSSDQPDNVDPGAIAIKVFGKTLFALDAHAHLLLLSFLNNPQFKIITLWILWICSGTAIFTCLQDGTSSPCGLYLSISVGVGMFWMEGNSCKVDDSSAIIKTFSVVHMLLGAIAMGSLRAYVAHTVAESRSLWYMAGDNEYVPKSCFATLSFLSCKHFLKNVGPKTAIYSTLALVVTFGVLYSVLQFGFSVLEAIFFSFSALACGGFVPIPSEDDSDKHYAVVAIFLLVGTPALAVSLSHIANAIAQYGSGFVATSELDRVLSKLVTEKEISMLNALGLEISETFNRSEFAVLILLRVGAVTPAFVSVVVDWYQGINVECDDLEEFEWSESSDNDAESLDGAMSKTPRETKQHRNKSSHKVAFEKFMSFSKLGAEDNGLRDRVNKSFSTMIVE